MKDPFLIKRIVVTERSSDLEALGKYVFVVKDAATKNEVKKAIKDTYGVDAVRVNVITRPPKTRRFRGIAGKRGGYKKAIVTLKTGQKIDTGR